MAFTNHMLPIDAQRSAEHFYSRKHIDKHIRTFLTTHPACVEKIEEGAKLLEKWVATDHFPSKNKLLAQLDVLAFSDLVTDVFTEIAYCYKPQLYVSVTAKLALRLGFSERRDGIFVIAGIVAVLASTDVFDIIKPDKMAQMKVESRIILPQEIIDAISRSVFIPPLLVAPVQIKENWESGYLTFNESRILGKGNNHDGDICLDVINTQNSVGLKLVKELLVTLEEMPKNKPDTLDELDAWEQFKLESYEIYHFILTKGNKFWLENGVDTRGRMYAKGYHITTQGSAFKKASIELQHEEIVEGVPAHLMQ